MHQPVLRKDTKADRTPPPLIITDSPYSTDKGDGTRAAASAAEEWLDRITKEPH